MLSGKRPEALLAVTSNEHGATDDGKEDHIMSDEVGLFLIGHGSQVIDDTSKQQGH